MELKVDSGSILKSIIKDTQDIVFVKDIQGRYVVANQAAANFLGVTVSQMLGKDDRELFPAEVAESILQADRQIIVGGKLLSYEEQVPNFPEIQTEKLPSVRSLLTNKYPWRDDSGNILGVIGISRDITDLKESQNQLHEQEQLLRLALQSANAGSWDWRIDTGEIIWSPENYDLYGIDPQLVEPQYQDWLNRLHPEDRERTSHQVEQVIARELPEFNCEFRIIHPQRGIRWIWGLGNLTFDRDNPIRLSGINIDITDRKNAEAKVRRSEQALKQREQELELITKVIPQQIWTALPDGEIDYINQRWQDYAGLTLEEIRQSGWESIVHPNDLPRVKKAWRQAVEKECNYNLKARIKGTDGVYHWFLARARPLRNKQGEISKWYGTNTSITRIVELEDKLRQQTEDLLRANQLKDEFLAIVSHELRTPLNPIMGWSQLLAGGKLNAEKTKLGIEIIQRNAKLQAQLIDDLLDVSRILRGKLDLKMIPLDLKTVIKSALATVQLGAEAKRITVETEFEPNIGKVLGDAARLQQIFWNLVSNGIKFTPEGGKITVTLERSGNKAIARVEDTGKGIEAEFLPYVFDRFRQAQSSSARQFGGLGLGLAIVRHLTELHGGTVNVASLGSNKGATFTVRLPLINMSKTEQLNNKSVNQLVQLNRFQDLKILAIDDEADSLDILTMVLEQEGAEVISVTSATAALEALERMIPDIIVSDIGMPKVDGYALMAQIRQLPQGKDLPAIALSAYAGEINNQNSLDAGYNRHIAKPIDIFELINTITELINE